MKNIIISLCGFLYIASISAQVAPSFNVIERKPKSNKTILRKVVLEDLTSSDSFDGKYFKIVKEKSNEAIRFNDEDPKVLLKAASTYHHLTLAKNFWRDRIGSQEAENSEKIIVRLEIKNLFDEQGQFAHDNRTPQFNNALSIPSGETPEWVPEDRQKSWNKEIWFRPMKKIETKSLAGIGPNPLTVSLEALEQPFLNYTTSRFNQTMLEHLFYPTYSANPLWVDVVRFVGTIAITKAIIEASKHTDKLFLEKWYYLDTALVPEVIYHEYAHIILSDHLEMSHSTPVIEGMADYFAAALANKKKMYAKVKGVSNAAGKNTQSTKLYTHWYESNRLATSDFTLSVLWDVRETLGEDVADQVVFGARKYLKTKSATINHHLIEAVLDSCSDKCPSPRRDKLMLYETFSAKGF